MSLQQYVLSSIASCEQKQKWAYLQPIRVGLVAACSITALQAFVALSVSGCHAQCWVTCLQQPNITLLYAMLHKLS